MIGRNGIGRAGPSVCQDDVCAKGFEYERPADYFRGVLVSQISLSPNFELVMRRFGPRVALGKGILWQRWQRVVRTIGGRAAARRPRLR